MPSRKPELRVVADLEELGRAGAGEVARLARKAASKRYFAVALAGGRTPRGSYLRLAEEPYHRLVPWQSLHGFWGDERHVPPDHPDSNFLMARETLLSEAPVPARNVHRMPAENPDADSAARDYETMLRAFFRLREGQVPRFDLVLLGLGADGHVASLFPGSEGLRETRRLVVASLAELPKAQRITVTPPVIREAANVLVLVSGEEKAGALDGALAPEGSVEECPARLLRESQGSVVFIADRAAAVQVKT